MDLVNPFPWVWTGPSRITLFHGFGLVLFHGFGLVLPGLSFSMGRQAGKETTPKGGQLAGRNGVIQRERFL